VAHSQSGESSKVTVEEAETSVCGSIDTDSMVRWQMDEQLMHGRVYCCGTTAQSVIFLQIDAVSSSHASRPSRPEAVLGEVEQMVIGEPETIKSTLGCRSRRTCCCFAGPVQRPRRFR